MLKKLIKVPNDWNVVWIGFRHVSLFVLIVNTNNSIQSFGSLSICNIFFEKFWSYLFSALDSSSFSQQIGFGNNNGDFSETVLSDIFLKNTRFFAQNSRTVFFPSWNNWNVKRNSLQSIQRNIDKLTLSTFYALSLQK